MRGLKGKTIVVTGGGGGIGGAVCRRFAEEGAKVAVYDINEGAARDTALAIVEAGGQATAFSADVTDYAAIKTVVADTEEKLGSIDVLVNNAGWDIFRPFVDTDTVFWEKLISINLKGALVLLHVVLPGMVERKRGRVINVASDAARVGSSGQAVYAACKGGVVALSKTLAREHARDGITVNVVCPGPTETALWQGYLEEAGNPEKLTKAFIRSVPMGRLGKPEDLPGVFTFLASSEADFITGQVISVSGGLTMHG